MIEGSSVVSGLAPHDLKLEIPATPDSVRDVLVWLAAQDLMQELPDETRGSAELVLAESLNNVVEHAYVDFPGTIRIMMSRRDGDLRVIIEDDGREMPGYDMPEGKLNEVAQTDDLAEGGYGWFLIRKLTRNLSYRRHGGCNRLSFLLDRKQLK